MPDKIRKLRIKLYDPEFNQLSDRLVDPGPEFSKGPKEVHEGFIELEVLLDSKDMVDKFIDYLKKLRGELPLDSKPDKKVKKVSGSAREQILDKLSTTEDSDDFQDLLRELNFTVISLDLLRDLGYDFNVPKPYTSNKYRKFVQLTRKAKNPLNHKYDPSLIIAVGEKFTGIIDRGTLISKKELKGFNSAKIKVPAKVKVKFPQFMNQDERNRFRAEMEKLKANKELKASKGFYCRWLSDIMRASPKEIAFPRAEVIPDSYADNGVTVKEKQKELLKAEKDANNR